MSINKGGNGNSGKDDDQSTITVDSDEWEEVPVKKDNKSDSESESESFIATQLTHSQQERRDKKKKQNKENTEKKPKHDNENEKIVLLRRKRLVILKSIEQLAKSLDSFLIQYLYIRIQALTIKPVHFNWIVVFIGYFFAIEIQLINQMDTHRIEILRRSRKETKELYDYQQSYLICTLIKEGHEVTVRRYRYKIEDRSITLHVLKIDNNEIKSIKPEYTDDKNAKRAKNQEAYIQGIDTMCET
ncbi:hypothetical protein EIN_326170 [Entamoeba invadens IP1]|uniref:Uncharacterized protein n=1 Tax=Entamoeba invadens IP1 TaxID=370355 RepID=L7FLR9_ENTIV|nr:hypothetical protein EIN_326170 [Entamoeba invadens IP1]ELP87556.1 hypothetical protein EIN_326170 [Entamoeba invadens IP1]|eukprot:XP_004254327.1 hypothetical protein EIN_326170 [Entamoeba invadens IP1]